MNALLLLSSAMAFSLAALGLWRPAEPFVQRIYPWVPAPALLLGWISSRQAGGAESVTRFPDLLLGVTVGLDDVGRAFLILTAAIWLLAGLYSRRSSMSEGQRRLFRFYFLATYSGTVGLTIAQDAPTFYAAYALMTIGGYGLVIQTRTQAAMIAGRVYIVVGLIGEMLALAGIILAASGSTGFSTREIASSLRTSPSGAWGFWLIFIGFGTKVGLVPLHFWIPRSYYWAPLPAVAVFSGAMTKAGILGWLRFLPPTESLSDSAVILGAGALMAFYGVFFGLVQTQAKTALAFSSLSQMGYPTMALATLMEPGAALERSTAAIVGYSLHHGITKVALFLGLGLLVQSRARPRVRPFVIAALAFCSLALIGFPWTSGAYAKALLKNAGAAGGLWQTVASPLMTLGSIGTTLLMFRFLLLCVRGDHSQAQPARGWISWGLSFAGVLLGAWLLPLSLSLLGIEARPRPSSTESLHMYIPVFFGSLLAAALTHRIWIKRSHLTPRPFDTILQGVYKAVWEDFPRDMNQLTTVVAERLVQIRRRLGIGRRAQRAVEAARRLHTSWALGCALFMAIGALLWAFFAGGAP